MLGLGIPSFRIRAETEWSWCVWALIRPSSPVKAPSDADVGTDPALMEANSAAYSDSVCWSKSLVMSLSVDALALTKLRLLQLYTMLHQLTVYSCNSLLFLPECVVGPRKTHQL